MCTIFFNTLEKITRQKISLTRCLTLETCNRAKHSDGKHSSENDESYDIVIAGGGIVGTAVARELIQRHPKLRMAILEKENKLAVHQSGHNSGVIHAGIYYQPGSLKARLCVEGLNLAYEYLDKNNIPYKKCGKLIVATSEAQRKPLADLYNRAIKNKVPDVKLLKGIKAIKEIEPYCNGVEAIWSPHTGIVDWELVTQHFGHDFKNQNGTIKLNYQVNGFYESTDPVYPVLITSTNGDAVKTKYVLTCCGLQSDIVSELSGCPKEPRIVPFRGEYLLLNPEKCSMIKGNIYPVPDPRLPFLGVHFTPRMDGSVWLGPNAVLAFKREGYSWFDLSMKELIDAVTYPGFQKLALKYMGAGFSEMLKSTFIRLQVKELQKFIPEISVADVKRGPAGVRAQALDIDGNLVDDFHFDAGKGPIGDRVLHCRNAPSPGATSSLAIAKMISNRIENDFKL